MAAQKKGLGSKGLGIEALINNKINALNASVPASVEQEGVTEIDINHIEPNREQPRRRFQEEALEELARSIKEYGVIQPIIVKKQDDFYELIAGERRWRAAKIAGIKTIPAIVKNFTMMEAFEIALVENLQREDLNPIEEALSYKRLTDEFHLSQEEIGMKVGKSRSSITNSLRLLNLDERVQNFVIENKISSGHAKVLLSTDDKTLQFELAEKVIEDGLSVRATESLVKLEQEKQALVRESKQQEVQQMKLDAYKSIEDELKSLFGTRVRIQSGKNKGKIEIEYYSEDDLDRLLGMMKNMEN